jgi:hypothetical protein
LGFLDRKRAIIRKELREIRDRLLGLARVRRVVRRVRERDDWATGRICRTLSQRRLQGALM